MNAKASSETATSTPKYSKRDVDRQCASCGGFCKPSGCERENLPDIPQKSRRYYASADGGLEMALAQAAAMIERLERELLALRQAAKEAAVAMAQHMPNRKETHDLYAVLTGAPK